MDAPPAPTRGNPCWLGICQHMLAYATAERTPPKSCYPAVAYAGICWHMRLPKGPPKTALSCSGICWHVLAYATGERTHQNRAILQWESMLHMPKRSTGEHLRLQLEAAGSEGLHKIFTGLLELPEAGICL